MFMGAHASVGGGPTPEEGWPEHAIELGQILLTPLSGLSIGTVRDGQTAT